MASSTVTILGYFHNATFRTWFLCFIAIDFLFIGAEIIWRIGLSFDLWGLYPEIFSIHYDRTIPEFFNYAKWLIVVGVLLAHYLRDHVRSTLVMSGVFTYLLLDDSLSIHERVGAWITRNGNLPDILTLPGGSLGELVYMLSVGALIAGILAFIFLSGSKGEKAMMRDYFLLFVGLAFFAIATDLGTSWLQVHQSGPWARRLLFLANMFEDGGEMIVTSAIAAITLVPPLRWGLRKLGT
jgi:hypothetical protein